MHQGRPDIVVKGDAIVLVLFITSIFVLVLVSVIAAVVCEFQRSMPD